MPFLNADKYKSRLLFRLLSLFSSCNTSTNLASGNTITTAMVDWRENPEVDETALAFAAFVFALSLQLNFVLLKLWWLKSLAAEHDERHC